MSRCKSRSDAKPQNFTMYRRKRTGMWVANLQNWSGSSMETRCITGHWLGSTRLQVGASCPKCQGLVQVLQCGMTFKDVDTGHHGFHNWMHHVIFDAPSRFGCTSSSCTAPDFILPSRTTQKLQALNALWIALNTQPDVKQKHVSRHQRIPKKKWWIKMNQDESSDESRWDFNSTPRFPH